MLAIPHWALTEGTWLGLGALKPLGSSMNTVPDYLDRELWDGFVEVRKKKGSRAPFTELAAKLILRKLEEFHRQGYDANSCLEESIENAWSSVYISRNTRMRQLSTAEQSNVSKITHLASTAVKRQV